MDEPSEPARPVAMEEMLGWSGEADAGAKLTGCYIRTGCGGAGSGVARTRHTKKATCINGDHPWAAYDLFRCSAIIQRGTVLLPPCHYSIMFH